MVLPERIGLVFRSFCPAPLGWLVSLCERPATLGKLSSQDPLYLLGLTLTHAKTPGTKLNCLMTTYSDMDNPGLMWEKRTPKKLFYPIIQKETGRTSKLSLVWLFLPCQGLEGKIRTQGSPVSLFSLFPAPTIPWVREEMAYPPPVWPNFFLWRTKSFKAQPLKEEEVPSLCCACALYYCPSIC